MPDGSGRGHELLQRQADDEVFVGLDRGADDVVAATDGEGGTVPRQSRVGVEDDIGGGVVRIGVHRVGTVELA